LDLLKSNIILDKSKILREGARLDESDKLIFYRTYKNYLKNKEQNKLNTIGSNQRPKLKILKILILVILLKNICSFINKKFTKNNI